MLSLREQMAVMRVEVTALQTVIKQGADNRYAASDASRDLTHVYSNILRLEKRLDAVELELKVRR